MKTRLFFAVAVLLAIAACGGSKDAPVEPAAPAPEGASAPVPERPVVAFVTNNASDFWKIAEAGTAKAAQEFNCDVEFRIPPNGTAQEQQQIVEDLITKGISGIAISPKDPENQTEMLNYAAEHVNLVTQDSDAPNSNRICYIGTNNHDAGKQAGEVLKQALPEGGRIMLFVGSVDAQNAQDRIKGIRDAVQGTNIEILDTRTDETDRAKAISNVQDALVTYPDLACLVGIWSYNGPAILNGVRDSGKLGQVKIVCFDEEDETLQGVTDGHIFATVVQQPYEFGYKSVQVLSELARGDSSSVPEDGVFFVPTKVINAENVAEFWANLKELRKQ